ncbi:hypothetical protein CVT25_010072 [Psilocybe cyanescens]|uniref:Uncharacterized protein n=1 Tax=Psilocybe cyanescens TaxID=93625 RepID=A0A409X3H2_PSICY|nr:hypothetical protein CVT25_010072 [Psilocybe cyanescens]
MAAVQAVELDKCVELRNGDYICKLQYLNPYWYNPSFAVTRRYKPDGTKTGCSIIVPEGIILDNDVRFEVEKTTYNMETFDNKERVVVFYNDQIAKGFDVEFPGRREINFRDPCNRKLTQDPKTGQLAVVIKGGEETDVLACFIYNYSSI